MHIVVMGVSGTGKTTVARALADELGRPFVEGDEHHPPANIKKMESGVPLDDEDRRPWLETLAGLLADAEEPSVLTCSALRRSYRDVLRGGAPELFFVHLHAPYAVLRERMGSRKGHFMPGDLLRSQLDTLEPLEPDEAGVLVDVSHDVPTVVREALEAVRAAGSPG